MILNKKYLPFLLFSTTFSSIAEDLDSSEIIVYSNKFYTNEKNSTHHAEIYDHAEIVNSGSSNLFEFLSNKTLAITTSLLENHSYLLLVCQCSIESINVDLL